jgi:hypothetical protein
MELATLNDLTVTVEGPVFAYLHSHNGWWRIPALAVNPKLTAICDGGRAVVSLTLAP